MVLVHPHLSDAHFLRNTYQDLFGSIESELQISEVNEVNPSVPGWSSRITCRNRWIGPAKPHRSVDGYDVLPHHESMD